MGPVIQWLNDGWQGAWMLPGVGQDERPNVLLVRLIVAVLVGIVVAVTRTLARSEGRPSPGLRTTLLLLTVLTAMVTEVIGTNTARAFGLAGALAVVRFRTVVEDTRDSAFVIFAMASGMAVGAGYLTTAMMCTAVISAVTVAVTWMTGPPVHEGKLEVRLRGTQTLERQVRDLIARTTGEVHFVGQTTGKEADVMDLAYRFRTDASVDLSQLVSQLRILPGVEKVNWDLK